MLNSALLNKIFMDTVDEFNDYRAKMNQEILDADNLVIKRIFNLDTKAFADNGALSTTTKEMLGLVSSMVLRCDDCVRYHLQKCMEEGVSKVELFEVFSIANLIGGTIVIPHMRRAVEYWNLLESRNVK